MKHCYYTPTDEQFWVRYLKLTQAYWNRPHEKHAPCRQNKNLMKDYRSVDPWKFELKN